MNSTLSNCDPSMLSGFEISTAVLGLLFLCSEALSKSGCKFNSLFDVLAGMFTACVKKKEEDAQTPIGPGVDSSAV